MLGSRLTSPALYHVSVRSLAVLAPASSPTPGAAVQVPSPPALSIEALIWYPELPETYSLAPHKIMPMPGVHKDVREDGLRAQESGRLSSVPRDVRRSSNRSAFHNR